MARKKLEYETRIVEPAFTPEPTTGWQKQGIVLKTMYHAYGLPGRIGDVVTVDPTKFDELVAKGFIKPV